MLFTLLWLLVLLIVLLFPLTWFAIFDLFVFVKLLVSGMFVARLFFWLALVVGLGICVLLFVCGFLLYAFMVFGYADLWL